MKVDDDLVRQVIRPRLRESHKGSYGRVLLVGGLYPYGGAIIMAAIACVNSGAGLVTVATDRENIIALHAHLPEAMAFDLRETERFLDNLRAADVILIGSGLGEEETADWSLELVLANIRSNQNLVVDGSGLNLWQRKSEQLAKVSPYTHSPSKGMGKTVWFSYFRAVGFQYSKSLRGVPKWHNSSCQEP